VLEVLCEAIKRLDGFKTKGIFRLAADKHEIHQLKKQLEKGDFQIVSKSCHPAADVLKIWLRELSEPLIPREQYNNCLKMAEDKESVLQFVDNLPEYCKETLAFLLDFLTELASHSSVTSMNPENIAIVFGPNLLKTSETTVDPRQELQNNAKEKRFITNLLEAWTERRKKNSNSESNESSSTSS